MKQTENGIFLEAEEYKEFVESNTNLAEQVKEEVLNGDGPKVSLYEMNRQLIAQMKPYGADEMETAKTLLAEWTTKNVDTYYMFLCHDVRYFTLFDFTRHGAVFGEFIDEFFEVLKDFNQIFDISIDTNGVIAVWANWEDDELPYCFYLFPYGKGVIRV